MHNWQCYTLINNSQWHNENNRNININQGHITYFTCSYNELYGNYIDKTNKGLKNNYLYKIDNVCVCLIKCDVYVNLYFITRTGKRTFNLYGTFSFTKRLATKN